jgi:hypothetical protein
VDNKSPSSYCHFDFVASESELGFLLQVHVRYSIVAKFDQDVRSETDWFSFFNEYTHQSNKVRCRSSHKGPQLQNHEADLVF